MSLRETLESKFDELDTGAPAEQPAPEVEPVEAQEPDPTETPAGQHSERARDDQGRFIEGRPDIEQPKPQKAPQANPGPSSTPQPRQGQATGTQQPLPGTVTQTKPPQSWKPSEREEWAKLPPVAQQAVLRREREVNIALQQAAEHSKGSAAILEALRPYEATVRQSGLEPAKYVESLVATAHNLSIAHPERRADLFAELLQMYPVPPAALDAAWARRLGGQPQSQMSGPMQQMADPRAIVREELAQIQNQAYEQRAQTQASELAEKLEFYGDVHETMADIIALWDKQGKQFVTEEDLQRAYTLACNMNPEVTRIMERRNAAKAVGTVKTATQRAKAASSSVRTQPSAAPAAQASGRRSVLEEAYDEIASR